MEKVAARDAFPAKFGLKKFPYSIVAAFHPGQSPEKAEFFESLRHFSTRRYQYGKPCLPLQLLGENMKRLCLAAALLAFACCAHAEFFGDSRSRQHEDYEKYLACIKTYSGSSALQEVTPSDVAAAAISACDAQYQVLMASTYQLFGMTQQAGDVLSETKQKARDYAIRIVIEVRRGR